MTLVAYYVSDHGYGHASRSIAVIRALLAEDPGVEVVVKSARPLSFLENSLADPQVTFSRRTNDVGLILKPGSFLVDTEATRHAATRWVESWPQWLEEEKRFWEGHRRPSVVVSDIAPQPFLLATAQGVPAMAVSNFTWREIYQELLGETLLRAKLDAAYQEATSALVPQMGGPLPFSATKEVGWVVRPAARSRQEVRRSLGVPDNVPLVYLNFGLAAAGMEKQVLSKGHAPFSLLLAEGTPGPKEALYFPLSDTESQDYVAASDLVVSKAGYSTIAEAVAGHVPMLLLRRDRVPEDRCSLERIEGWGFGEGIEETDLRDGLWVERAVEVLARREQYSHVYAAAALDLGGAEQVAQAVLQLAAT